MKAATKMTMPVITKGATVAMDVSLVSVPTSTPTSIGVSVPESELREPPI